MKIKKILMVVATAALTLGIMASASAAGKFSVKADELQYDLESGSGLAKGNVVAVQDNGRATADYAEFNSKEKTAVFTGKVILEKDGSQIVCDKLIMYSENNFSAVGRAAVVKEGKRLEADQIDYDKDAGYATTVGGWAMLTDVDGSTVAAQKIDYRMSEGLVQAHGGVQIKSPARNLEASGDRAVYETKANGFIELTGNAKAVQDGNSVEGDKLRLANNSLAKVTGNVEIIYLPQAQPQQVKPQAEQLA